jgi:hypothetical protein
MGRIFVGVLHAASCPTIKTDLIRSARNDISSRRAKNAACQLAAFRAPFLDASCLTPEVQVTITELGKNGRKTTKEGEEYILQVKISWHAHEYQRRGEQGIHEDSSKDNATSMGGVYLPDNPATFKFVKPQEFENVSFDSPAKREEDKFGDEEDVGSDDL